MIGLYAEIFGDLINPQIPQLPSSSAILTSIQPILVGKFRHESTGKPGICNTNNRQPLSACRLAELTNCTTLHDAHMKGGQQRKQPGACIGRRVSRNQSP